ncbi:MAG: sensor histidine kinase [Terriglobia bacterium]
MDAVQPNVRASGSTRIAKLIQGEGGTAWPWGLAGALLGALTCGLILFSHQMTSAGWLYLPQEIVKWVEIYKGIIVLSAGLILPVTLLGILIERDRKRLAQAMIISELVRSIHSKPTLKASIEYLLQRVRVYLDADEVRLATEEKRSVQTFVWELKRSKDEGKEVVRSFELRDSERQAYFSSPHDGIRRLQELQNPGVDYSDQLRVASNGNERSTGFFSAGLHRFTAPSDSNHDPFDVRVVSERRVALGGFSSMLLTSFSIEGKWFGRLTICNPRGGRRKQIGRLEFLEDVVRQVGPAIYKKYLVGRLRSQARATERARLAQDLHDGVIQSLMGAEMQIDVLQRLGPTNAADTAENLRGIQELLRNEIANLRDRMHQVRPLEVEPAQFLNHLTRITERFRRDLAISADFVAESEDAPSSPRVCSEMVRIVQEALTNVRKHSGAKKVVVSFGRENGSWRLCIQDDGRGFGFTGRLSFAQLESSQEGPLVIKERVRSIGGDLVIESIAGAGARLEILSPRIAHARYS